MVVLSSRAIGPHAELLVSEQVARTMLFEIAEAARPLASSRWEQELVQWLDRRAERPASLDVADFAWTPDHFDQQRHFVLEAIARAMFGSLYGPALARWRALIEAHPRASVQVGRRWLFEVTA